MPLQFDFFSDIIFLTMFHTSDTTKGIFFFSQQTINFTILMAKGSMHLLTNLEMAVTFHILNLSSCYSFFFFPHKIQLIKYIYILLIHPLLELPTDGTSRGYLSVSLLLSPILYHCYNEKEHSHGQSEMDLANIHFNAQHLDKHFQP